VPLKIYVPVDLYLVIKKEELTQRITEEAQRNTELYKFNPLKNQLTETSNPVLMILK
jgi:hypothetical protein